MSAFSITYLAKELVQSKSMNDALAIPGRDDGVVNAYDVRLNTCLTSRSAYSTLVHEAGHALGIRLGEYHPTIADTVMNPYSPFSSPCEYFDCSPYPFDIMAIYALYQTQITSR